MLKMTSSIDDVLLSDNFFQIAKKIYKGDPYWISENEDKVRQQFLLTNSYFDKNLAKVFVHDDDARLVGFYNPELEIEGEKAAYFGFWETQNDLPINQLLFQQVEDWAKACGATRIYGPINFSTYQNNRLKTDCFDSPSFIDEPYNPAYYPDLLAQLGYEKKYGYLTGINQNVSNLIKQIGIGFNMLKKQSEKKFTIEKLTGDVWLNNLDELYPLVDAIFSKNFAYTAISREAFQAQCGEGFAKKLCPKTSVIIYDEDKKIAGFFIAYPDYGSLVNQQGVENLTELASSDINYTEHYPQLKQPRLLLAKTCGIAPKYRSAGLFPLMSMQLSVWAEGHYEQTAGAMVREDNASMSFYTSLIKAGNKDFVLRSYALFTKSLTNDAIDLSGVDYD